MKPRLLFIFICIPLWAFTQNLTNNTPIEITKSWYQEPDGYTYPMNISVPPGDVPENGFPVCIILHGNGGQGGAMIAQFINVLQCHVLVAPSGYENSWNICGENSDAPDVEMVEDLVNTLQGFSNINPNQIRIVGSSNGSGLANRVFIENTNPGIDIICAIVSHLNEPQYHSDGFFRPSAATNPASDFCGYDDEVNPLSSRKYLSISNSNDGIIPYTGGSSVVGVDFLDAEEAAYNIALNQGYTGNPIASGTSFGNPQITEFSYLSGKVVHIKGDAQHSTNQSQRDYIKNYFSDCETAVSNENSQEKEFKIFPNPTNSILTIEGIENEKIEYSILNILGEKVSNGEGNTETIQIDVSALPSQIYFLKINHQIFRVSKI